MKNKGFTLIELLSVIVILAIIALIATPIILNIIDDSKKEADKRSVEMYAKSVENAIVQYQLKENKKPTKIEELVDYIKLDEENIDCEIRINKDGSIYVYKCKKDKDDSIIDYEYGIPPTYDNGEIIYFDVSKGAICTKEEYENSFDITIGDYLNSSTGYNGLNGVGNQNSCLKFYAFNDVDGKKLNLLLDHNTTSKLAWNSNGSNKTGPTEVIQKLYEDTKGWNGTITPLDYKYNHSSRAYTIEYSKVPSYQGATTPYKARLITAQEIAQITGADQKDTLNFKEESSTEWYYFHDYTQNYATGRGDVCKTQGCKYGWLYDRTVTNCLGNVCSLYGALNYPIGRTFGYWTSSAHAKETSWAVLVYAGGKFSNCNVNDPNYLGVRPVIEVLKSNL